MERSKSRICCISCPKIYIGSRGPNSKKHNTIFYFIIMVFDHFLSLKYGAQLKRISKCLNTNWPDSFRNVRPTWLMKDGVRAHYATPVGQWLNENFPVAEVTRFETYRYLSFIQMDRNSCYNIEIGIENVLNFVSLWLTFCLDTMNVKCFSPMMWDLSNTPYNFLYRISINAESRNILLNEALTKNKCKGVDQSMNYGDAQEPHRYATAPHSVEPEKYHNEK